MRTMWIGGNHGRHFYFAGALAKQRFPLAGCIIVGREGMIPAPPAGISDHDALNFVRHFGARGEAEQRWFSAQSPPDVPTLRLPMERLNSMEAVEFVRDIAPDVVFILGSGLIKDPLAAALPRETINLHLGLSPRYRGAATLFWPFYFQEPNWAGTTFHYIVAEPDAGPIVHQVVPPLDPNDGIHDVACKAVIHSAAAVEPLLGVLAELGAWKTGPQKRVGRTFFMTDFRPSHLRVNYDLFGDRMAKAYLEGDLLCRAPPLFKQF